MFCKKYLEWARTGILFMLFIVCLSIGDAWEEHVGLSKPGQISGLYTIILVGSVV